MDNNQAMRALNSALKSKNPRLFSSSWIFHYAPEVYRYARKHIRNPLGNIDWDRAVCQLDKEFQRRWTQRRPKKVKTYISIREVRTILKPFKEKLYIFIAPAEKDDRLLRDAISIALVRLAQRGNKKAEQELVPLLRYMIDEWLENCWQLKRWKGYTDDIEIKIKSCIRCYRFTGTFVGYLFRTLEYSGRGLRPLHAYSLDEGITYGSDKRKIDNVVQDVETSEIHMYDPARDI